MELDAKVVVDWVGGSNCPNNSHSSLIADCRYLFDQLPHVKIKQSFRQANQCVDALAKHGAPELKDPSIFDSPPGEITLLLYFDSVGVCFLRSRPNS